MHNDRCTGLVVLALCALGWFYLLPNYAQGHEQQIFPRAVLIFIALPALVLAIRRQPPAQGKERTGTAATAERKAFVKMSIMAGAYLLYLVLIPVLGFFVSSFIATIGFFLFLGIRSLKSLVLVPLGMLGCIYLVLEVALNFQLPSGILF